MRTSFHRQNKNRAATEQERVGEVVGEVGLLCSPAPHRLQLHLWGQERRGWITGTPRQDIGSYSGAEGQGALTLLTCVPLIRLFHLPGAELFRALGEGTWREQSEAGALLRLDFWNPSLRRETVL